MYQIKDRPQKRAKQTILAKLIKDKAPDLANGHIIVIPGPEPKLAIKSYEDASLATEYTFVENDISIFPSVCAEVIKYQLKAKVIYGDIFSIIIPNDIVGLDVDLLGSFSYKRSVALIDLISKIKQDKFWLRFTASHRAINTKERNKRAQFVRNGIDKLGLKIISDKMPNYKEIDDQPMVCWQVICQRKTEDEMTQRTLGKVPVAEQEMIRDLVAVMRDNKTNYNNKDLAKAFKISSRTVCAIKANMTMDDRNVGPGRW